MRRRERKRAMNKCLRREREREEREERREKREDTVSVLKNVIKCK
jgi:hypothetical protein